MIEPLRSRHRTIIILMLLALPVLFISGLLARHTVPVNTAIPHVHEPLKSRFTVVVSAPVPFEEVTGVTYRILAEEASLVRRAIELSAREQLRLPELLVYWTAAGATPGNMLEEGVLIGSWSVTETSIFELPDMALDEDGSIHLYSLPQANVVASSRLDIE